MPDGWRFWTSVALILLLAVYQVDAIAAVGRSSAARASIRQQSAELADFTPHTRTDV